MIKKRLGLCLCACLAALVCTAAALQSQQHALSEKLIRLHVVANSDTKEDQAVKLKVRDAVLQVTEPMLQMNMQPEQALVSALPEIRAAAEDCLRKNGFSQPVTVSFGVERFPTRVYEGFSLPAGSYRSLRVTIGAGEGQNWWCVVFPSICFRATAAELEQAVTAAGFTEEEVRLITEDGEGYVLKFKALELLEQMKKWLFSGKW